MLWFLFIWYITHIAGQTYDGPDQNLDPLAINCLRNAVQAFNGNPAGGLPAILIPLHEFISHVPFCIITHGYNPGGGHANDCQQNDYGLPLRGNNKWQLLNNFYSCINNRNQGHTVSQGAHTPVLWSGRLGKEKAEHVGTTSRNGINRNGRIYMVGGPDYWPDTHIWALRKAFGSRQHATGGSHSPLGHQIADFICTWLLFNADFGANVGARNNHAITWYGSVDFVHGGNRNVNYANLVGNNPAPITQAFIVNTFFFKIEMLALTRLAQIKGWEPIMNLVLKKYVNGVATGTDPNNLGNTAPLLHDREWSAPKTLYGGQLSQIPVIVRPLVNNFPAMGLYRINGVTNLLQLFTAYNGICDDANNPDCANANHKIRAPLTGAQVENLARFVEWSKVRFRPNRLTCAAATDADYGDDYELPASNSIDFDLILRDIDILNDHINDKAKSDNVRSETITSYYKKLLHKDNELLKLLDNSEKRNSISVSIILVLLIFTLASLCCICIAIFSACGCFVQWYLHSSKQSNKIQGYYDSDQQV